MKQSNYSFLPNWFYTKNSSQKHILSIKSKQLAADLRVAKEKVVKSRRKEMELANDLVNPETSLRQTIVIEKQTVSSSSMIWEEKEKNND